MDQLSVLQKAVDQTGRIVSGVSTDQFSDSTPCADWNVKELLNHTIGVVEMFDDAAQTKPFRGELFADDLVGIDPGSAYEQRAAKLRATIANAAALERTWTMPFGEVPGMVGCGFATLEVFQHGWDVAKATGQKIDFDPEVTQVADMTAQMMPADQVRTAGVFGAEGNCPEGASAEDRVAAFLGRPV
jgi:uncharacterized protein (TIGR03086 family)